MTANVSSQSTRQNYSAHSFQYPPAVIEIFEIRMGTCSTDRIDPIFSTIQDYCEVKTKLSGKFQEQKETMH